MNLQMFLFMFILMIMGLSTRGCMDIRLIIIYAKVMVILLMCLHIKDIARGINMNLLVAGFVKKKYILSH